MSQNQQSLSFSSGLFFTGEGFDTKIADQNSIGIEYFQSFNKKSRFNWQFGISVGNSSRTWHSQNAITNISTGEQFVYETMEFSFVRTASQMYSGLGVSVIDRNRFESRLAYSVGVVRYSFSNTGRSHKEVYVAPDRTTIEFVDVFHRIDQNNLTRFVHGPSLDLLIKGASWKYGLSYRFSFSIDETIPPLSSLGFRLIREL